MQGYYSAKLSGARLQQCYGLASPRVKQYLEAEIAFVSSRLRPTDAVLECRTASVPLRSIRRISCAKQCG